jgi:hypothetical protein
MKIQTKEELLEFIQHARDVEKKTFREIYMDLKKMGYKSKRTGQTLSEVSVRNMLTLEEKHQRSRKAEGGSMSIMALIEKVLDTQGIPAQAKIDLINGIRQQKPTN